MDDTGTTYPPYNPAPPRTLTIAAQNSAEEYVSFDGALNPRAKQLTVTSGGLAGNQNIRSRSLSAAMSRTSRPRPASIRSRTRGSG